MKIFNTILSFLGTGITSDVHVDIAMGNGTKAVFGD